ncbi:MAG: alpha-glucoside-specific PTS transporter subunit IIBC [Fusobacteriaceae bacterium]
MLKHFQRLGGALFAPVLLFAFSGIVVAFTIILKNPDFVGELANPDGTFYKVIFIIEEGGWTVFRQLPLLFAIGLPIGLANKAQARAAMTSLVAYLTFNYFINGILTFWGADFAVDFAQNIGGVSGLTAIAGIKTLDTSIVGAIVASGLSIMIHNKYFEKKLPDFLGIFQGSTLVSALSFLLMLPLALVTCIFWPKVQLGINSLQGFLAASGALGVWIYTFLERILIPTGLHHFVYGPFIFGPTVVDGGIAKVWAENIVNFSNSTLPLKELFPAGGFSLHGNSKVFGSIGIALAFYKTADSKKKKIVSGLIIPATLTAVLVGITEPLEFTFLFVAPFLFVIHSILAATMAMVMYMFGVVGNMGGGLIEMMTLNWLPLMKNHSKTVMIQILIGLGFIPIYYFIFKTLIERYKLKTPGREGDEEEVKLYTKKDYKGKRKNGAVGSAYLDQAYQFLEALGGVENVATVNNCATRLRIVVNDSVLVAKDSHFKSAGAHGVVRNGDAVQIIVGLSVPQVRECFEELISDNKN